MKNLSDGKTGFFKQCRNIEIMLPDLAAIYYDFPINIKRRNTIVQILTEVLKVLRGYHNCNTVKISASAIHEIQNDHYSELLWRHIYSLRKTARELLEMSELIKLDVFTLENLWNKKYGIMICLTRAENKKLLDHQSVMIENIYEKMLMNIGIKLVDLTKEEFYRLTRVEGELVNIQTGVFYMNISNN